VALVGIGFTRLTMLALELRDNYEDASGEEPVDIGRRRVETHNKMVQMAKPDFVLVKGDNQYEACATRRAASTRDGLGDDSSYSAVLASAAHAVGVSGLFGSSSKVPGGDEPAQGGSSSESGATASSSSSGPAAGGFSCFGAAPASGAAASASSSVADNAGDPPVKPSLSSILPFAGLADGTPRDEEAGSPVSPGPDSKGDSPADVEARPSNADLLVDPTDVCTICFEKAKNAVLLACGHGGVCYSCSIDVCVTSGHCPFCRKEIGQIVTIGLGQVSHDAYGNQLIPVIGPK